MALFSCRLVNFVILIVLICLDYAKTYSVRPTVLEKGSSNNLLNSYLDEIRDVYVRTHILQQSKRELRQMKDKIDFMVNEIDRLREERFNTEKLFRHPGKRYENDMLRLAKRRLKKNKSKIEELEGKIYGIKHANVRYRRNRDQLLDSYDAEFVGKFPVPDKLDKILVKRKVPRNVESSKFEYNAALKSLYRPLLKLHDSFEDNVFLRAGKYDNYVEQTDKATNVIDKIVRLIQEREKQPNILRQGRKNETEPAIPRQGKGALFFSVEENDPYAPGKNTWDDLMHNEGMTTSTKPPFWLPEYSLFNFWTYHEDIMQDKCPENQIKSGHICIAGVPH